MGERMAADEAVGPAVTRYHAEIALRAIADWRATLDALREIVPRDSALRHLVRADASTAAS